MLPQEIEQESFRIIRSELGAHTFSAAELAVAVRVIHASGDFEFRDILRIHPDAIRAGVDAFRRGCTVVTDVRMVEVGISAVLLAQLGGRTVCDIRGAAVREQAKALGLTRSTMAMRQNAAIIAGNVVAIGNAPTALLEVLRLIRDGDIRPALVVGVPVGFVNAAESKEELLAAGVPYVTALGRKGGSTIAVAIVNALLHLAVDALDERAR
jgi:precorrin-8X/cobalt-precorrin-8 methylmutase